MNTLALFGAAMLSAAALSGAAGARSLTLDQALRAPTRTAPMTARDGARHPEAELAFFGITPRSSVVEIWPGGGYWTQILAPYLHDGGTYTLAMGPPDGDGTERHFALTPKFRAMLAAQPEAYDRIRFTQFGAHHPELAPTDSADLVLTFRNLHDWMEEGDAPQMLAAIRAALKPGGVLGIEDHRANTRAPQDPKADNGYVRQDYAIALIERAGFRFAGSSEIDANPRDTADYPKGVWTLPPSFVNGATDHAKYAAIGEADNFVLKFVKR